MKKIEFKTVISCGNPLVLWSDEVSRYHVWLNEDGTPQKAIIYKNSIANRGQPGGHDTRLLDGLAKKNKVLFELALASADVAGAIAAENKRIAGEKEQDRIEREEQLRIERLNAAAPELLKALELICKTCTTSPLVLKQIAQTAIANLKGPQ